MKISRSDRKIGKYGGLAPIHKRIEQCHIRQLIRSVLGERVKQAEYGFDDTILGWGLSAFCGGKHLNYITKIADELQMHRGIKIPSHDTLGRSFKKLAVPNKRVRAVQNDGLSFTYHNDNPLMNSLMFRITKAIGALQENVSYTVDVDQTFVSTECRGAFFPTKEEEEKFDNENALRKKLPILNGDKLPDVNLKKIPKERSGKIGFAPMVALIGALPVNISLRSGNAMANFRMHEFVKDTLALAKESNIKIGRFISDGAGYLYNTLEFLHNQEIKFLVRYTYKKTNKEFARTFKACNNWRKTRIKTTTQTIECEVGDVPYKMWDDPKIRRAYPSPTYRVVFARKPTEETLKRIAPKDYETKASEKEKQDPFKRRQLLEQPGNPNAESWTVIDGYRYTFIITNDFEKSSEDLIMEYNKRGNAERQFSHMKKDFAWKYPPFMKMDANTVFLIVAAISNNILRGTRNWLKKQIPEIDLKATLDEFINKFVRIAFEVIDENYYFFNTKYAFEKIKF